MLAPDKKVKKKKPLTAEEKRLARAKVRRAEKAALKARLAGRFITYATPGKRTKKKRVALSGPPSTSEERRKSRNTRRNLKVKRAAVRVAILKADVLRRATEIRAKREKAATERHDKIAERGAA